MLIGIDGNEANVAERVGVNTYAFEVLWGLYRLQDQKNKNKYIVYLSRKPRNDLPKERDGWEYMVLPGEALWILRRLVPELFRTNRKLDVFFSPGHYSPIVTRVPQVCSIMDLGYLESSGQFKKYDYWQLKLWSAMSMMVSKYIISISNATKVDIVRHYRRVRGKVVVVHLGYDKLRFNERCDVAHLARVRRRYAMGGGEYVLFLSTLKPSKNIEGLLEAWARVERKYPETKLVVAGKKGWLFESIFKKAEALGIVERVVFTGFIAEEDKPVLIKGAKAFVLPSYWEGFGLDVLSAMACGVPVITSDRGSLPEVVGKAGTLVDPGNVEEMASAIDEVLSLPSNEYNKRVEMGIAQAKKFSWEKTAEEILDVLERAGGK